MKPRLRSAIFGLCWALAAIAGRCEDGTLGRVRDEVRRPVDRANPVPEASSVATAPGSSEARGPQETSIVSAFGDLMVGGGVLAGASPIWLPRLLLADEGQEVLFPGYPYDRVRGYLMTGDHPTETDPDAGILDGLKRFLGDAGAEPTESILLERWKVKGREAAGRLSADYGDQFDGIQRLGAAILLSNASRWCYDAEWQYYQERLPAGGCDYLNVGDFNITYRFAQSHRAEFRTGIGFNWLQDVHRSDFGFNFTYGADFFPSRPWVISTSIDWGSLGNGDLFRGRATVGAMIRSLEAYSGYEYLDIGRTGISSFVAGLRWWF